MTEPPETSLARVIYETARPPGAPLFDQLHEPEQEKWRLKAQAGLEEMKAIWAAGWESEPHGP